MIALLSATWDEISRLNKDLQITEEGASGELKYKIGELYGQSVVIAVAGVGIRRARAGAGFIIQKFKPRLIICAGLGGALSPDLRVGDIVLGESVISFRKNETKELYFDFSIPENEFKKGALLTESRFIHEPQEKKRLFDGSNALVVDMETWGVAEAARQSKTPVASVRAVSDEAHERLPDMGAIYNSLGNLDLGKGFPYFILNPSLFYPYVRFRYGNSKKASCSLHNFLAVLIPKLSNLHDLNN